LARYYWSVEKKNFYGLLKKLLGVGILLGIAGVTVAILVGEPILAFFYGPEYKELSNLLICIMTAAGIGYISQFFGLSLTVGRLFRYMVLSNFAGSVVIMILSYVFIRSHGLLGAAFALIAGNFTILTIYSLVAWRKLGICMQQNSAKQLIQPEYIP
jgi:O-antigen/teichoic acid export membrane protein